MGPALMVAAAGGLTALAAVSQGNAPHPRIFLGAAIAGAGMLALGQFAPELAGKMAGLVFTTALMVSGYDVSQGVARALNR